MKTYTIENLIEFLEENKEEDFYYTDAVSGCLLAKFFKKKGVEFSRASYSYDPFWRVFDDNSNPIGEIEGKFGRGLLQELHGDSGDAKGFEVLTRLKDRLNLA